MINNPEEQQQLQQSTAARPENSNKGDSSNAPTPTVEKESRPETATFNLQQSHPEVKKDQESPPNKPSTPEADAIMAAGEADQDELNAATTAAPNIIGNLSDVAEDEKENDVTTQEERKQRQPMVSSQEPQAPLTLDPRFKEIAIIENQVEDDMVCDICLCRDWTDDDLILVCEKCFAPTHQKCLRKDIADKVPEEDWYCQRCTVLQADESLKVTSISCEICTQKKGILVRLEASIVPGLANNWVHVQCINWIPQLSFKDNGTKTEIVLTDSSSFFQQSDLEGDCSLCQGDKGLLVNCDHIGCTLQFHPRCMIKAKLIQDFETMASGPLMSKLKDQPKPPCLQDGTPNPDPCFQLFEDRVCTFCEVHRKAYEDVPTERRMSCLKTRPLKNPFVVCGKIKGVISDSKFDEARHAYDQLVKRTNEHKFGTSEEADDPGYTVRKKRTTKKKVKNAMATDSALTKQQPKTSTPAVVTRANSSAVVNPMAPPQNAMPPNGMMTAGMNPMSAFQGMGMATQMLNFQMMAAVQNQASQLAAQIHDTSAIEPSQQVGAQQQQQQVTQKAIQKPTQKNVQQKNPESFKNIKRPADRLKEICKYMGYAESSEESLLSAKDYIFDLGLREFIKKIRAGDSVENFLNRTMKQKNETPAAAPKEKKQVAQKKDPVPPTQMAYQDFAYPGSPQYMSQVAEVPGEINEKAPTVNRRGRGRGGGRGKKAAPAQDTLGNAGQPATKPARGRGRPRGGRGGRGGGAPSQQSAFQQGFQIPPTYATPNYQPSSSFMNHPVPQPQQQQFQMQQKPILAPPKASAQPHEAVKDESPNEQSRGRPTNIRQDLAEQKFFLAESFFKMLKFVQKNEFNDSKKAYSKDQILNAFTFLCQKVNVYNEQSREYDLNKSDILKTIFQCSQTFQQHQVWDSILLSKCTPVPRGAF